MSLVKQRSPQMKGSTRRLSDIARHVVIPQGIVSTGWPAVEATLAQLDVHFDDWQIPAGQLILSKDAKGLYATTVGGCTLSIPRQVGKTFMIGWIVFALCIIYPGLTVVWTAHRASTADETFSDMKSMAGTAKVSPHILRTPDNGTETSIEFINGSRIVFGARERGFGRGFSEIDVVVFDEGQILTERAIDDMVPAQNASKNALTIMIGTPPKPIDPSEVFEEARKAALEGEILDALYIEFSADPDADIDDREQWKKANPSFPGRTSLASMLRMRRRLSEESFRREAMGIWDEDTGQSAIPAKAWDALRVEPDDEWPLAAIGLDMNPERTKITLAVAARADDGVHVELVAEERFSELASRELIEWIVTRARRRIPVVIDAYSPIRSIEAELKRRKVKVFILNANELAQACGGLYDAVVKDHSVSHIGQDELDMSLAGAVKQKFGDGGAWKWNRKGFEFDLGPVMAVTCAHFGAVKFSKVRSDSGVGRGKVLVM